MGNSSEENWLTKTPGAASKQLPSSEPAQRKLPQPVGAPGTSGKEKAPAHEDEGLGRDM